MTRVVRGPLVAFYNFKIYVKIKLIIFDNLLRIDEMNFGSSELREIGKLIQSKRKTLKLSQAWLAKKLDTKPSAISNIENGNRSVPRDKVEILSEALGIDVGKLIPTRKIVNEIKGLSISFRGLEALPKEALEELQGHYLRLQKEHALKGDVVKKSPVDAAMELLAKCGIHNPPVDLNKICRQLHADVTYTDKIDFSGYIFHDQGKGFSGIGVKSDMTPGRKNFTIAHELGHLTLEHLSKGKKIECNEVGLSNSERERDADLFASNLLMPEKWVKEVLDDGINGMESINRISDMFQVSRTAAGRRLVETSSVRCAVIMSENGNIKWGVASRNIGGWIKRGTKLARGSQAYKIMVRPLQAKNRYCPTKIEYWFDTPLKGKFYEHSSRLYQDSIMTLVWEKLTS